MAITYRCRTRGDEVKPLHEYEMTIVAEVVVVAVFPYHFVVVIFYGFCVPGTYMPHVNLLAKIAQFLDIKGNRAPFSWMFWQIAPNIWILRKIEPPFPGCFGKKRNFSWMFWQKAQFFLDILAMGHPFVESKNLRANHRNEEEIFCYHNLQV